jgi:hypothetical protein
MPAESVGLVGALHLYPDRVTIVAGRYEASHPRHVQKKAPAAVLGWRPNIAPAPATTRPSATS